MTFSPDASDVYRTHVTKFVPSSGYNQPSLDEIRALLAQYEAVMNGFTTNGGLIYQTMAAMNAAATTFTEPRSAWQFEAGSEGVYVLNPSTDTWTKVGRLPYDFVIGTDTGAGTANAIQITTDIPVVDGMIVAVSLFEATTGPTVTISINGGTALTLKTPRGTDASALGAGQEIWFRVAGSEAKMINDNDIATLIAQAEAVLAEFHTQYLGQFAANPTTDVNGNPIGEGAFYWNTVSKVYRYWDGDSWETFPNATVADGAVTNAKLADVATATIKGRTTAGTGEPEDLTGDQVAEIIDPDENVLTGEGLRLTYHKARGAWHVKAFGTSLTAVGTGTASADTAALQAAFDNEEMVDITGADLLVNNVIDVDYAGANISSAMATRIGDTASSKIAITDTALPKLFNCSSTNFEASGFHIEAGDGNVTTTLFHFERPSGSASDVDAVIDRVSSERGAKFFHIYGRGLRIGGSVVANIGTCVGDIDWPASWTPNGSTNDLQTTGMRAYHFSSMRFHGCATGIRNIGSNKLNCRGIIMNDILADIGVGAAFVGVAIESLFTTIESQLNAINGGMLFDLYPGSKKSDFIGFKGGGYKDGSTSRLSRNMIKINATSTDEVNELHFIGGSIGPTNRDGVVIVGGGKAKNILFQGVSFDRCGLEGAGYSPFTIFNSGGTLTEVSLKLAACNFDTTDTTPSYIVAGTNTSAITVFKDSLTTKPGAIPWAQGSVVLA